MLLNIILQNKDEEIFASKIRDIFKLSQDRNITKFSQFLDERQQKIAQYVSTEFPTKQCVFTGGFDNAIRKIACVLSSYDDSDKINIPIGSVTFTYRKQDDLTHRDFLGALMNLKIKREIIGDILVGEGKTVVFFLENMVQMILFDIKKIGNVGVNCTIGHENLLEFEQQYLTIKGTVSSLRADCVIAMFMNISREKVSDMIKTELVTINSVSCKNRSQNIEKDDKIAVRGFGKVVVDNIGNVTKKNRIHLECKKFL